ncbi:MAG: S41 family peptidase [Chloroflexi bacterium]|nr:S41 family peptidase [Chloroflexota bacterium]
MLPDDPRVPRGDDAATDPPDPDSTDLTGSNATLPLTVPVAVAGPTARPRSPVFAVAMVLVAVLAGGALFMSGYSVGRGQGLAPGTPADEQAAWRPFWDVYSAIVNRYPLEDLERRTLIEGAIRGLVDAVGAPYSSYLSPDDFDQTIRDITGEFEGIGAEIGTVDGVGNTIDCGTFGPDCQLVIIAPLDGSPAERAGLRSGDVILAVDGSTLDGLTPDEARDRIRGEAGTEVELRIRRYDPPAGGPPIPAPTPAPTAAPSPGASPGASPAPSTAPPRVVVDEFQLSVTRAKVVRRDVTSRTLADGNVGYVRIAGFSDAAADAFEAAVKKHVDDGVEKLVIDLRGNPGGFLTDARRVASVFIESGPVYWQEDANGVQTQTDAIGGGVATDEAIQVVLLIDGGSASASEIVAGALQDRGRATLVGQTSFGKGTVQEWIGLEDLGGVRLTVWKWLTPNKRWIHHVGITPDVPVEVPADTPRNEDPVLDKALEILGASAMSSRALLPAA